MSATQGMLATCRGHISLLVLGQLLLLGVWSCRDELPRDTLLPGLTQPSVDQVNNTSTWAPRLVREYGSGSGSLAFGFPIAAATLEDGTLVVADLFECALFLIRRPAGLLQTRIGGCGEGPSEFRQIRVIEVIDDSIFVYDQGANVIVVVDDTGVEARRMNLDPSGFTLSHLAILTDTTLVVAIESVGYAAVRLMDRRTGKLGRVLVEAPRIATRAPREVIRHLAACVAPAREPRIIVAMNEWVLEGVGIDAGSGEERFHFVAPPLLQPKRNQNGNWVPGPTSADVRCSRSGALFRITTPGPAAEVGGNVTSWRAGAVILEGRTYSGERLFRSSIEDEDSLLRGPLADFRGDTAFVLAQTIRPFPVVGEFVFERHRR